VKGILIFGLLWPISGPLLTLSLAWSFSLSVLFAPGVERVGFPRAPGNENLRGAYDKLVDRLTDSSPPVMAALCSKVLLRRVSAPRWASIGPAAGTAFQDAMTRVTDEKCVICARWVIFRLVVRACVHVDGRTAGKWNDTARPDRAA